MPFHGMDQIRVDFGSGFNPDVIFFFFFAESCCHFFNKDNFFTFYLV